MAENPEKFKRIEIEKLDAETLDKLRDTILLAKSNLVNYRKLMLDVDPAREVPSAKFHYRWSDVLLNETRSFAIEGFRESGKDQLVMRSFPLYCLTFPEKRLSYIVLIMANTTLVNKKMKELQREFLDNKLISSGVIKVREESADSFEVLCATTKGESVTVRIEGYGKGSSIRGLSWGNRRPDIVIMNDIQDIADANSDTTMVNDWNWFLDDVKFLGKSTRIFMIGNNLGAKCIIERIAHSNDTCGFTFERVPVCTALDETGVSNWAEVFPMDYIIKERLQYQQDGKLSIWVRNRMCECVSDEDKMFDSSTFKYFHTGDIEKLASRCNLYLRIDPGAGLKEKNDPTAMVTVGVNHDNQWFIFDVVNKRMKQSEKIDKTFELVSKWGYKNVGIENSKEGIILMQDLCEQMVHRNMFFNMVEIKIGNKPKEFRIEQLQPMFNAGVMWLPSNAQWLPELEYQLTMYSKVGKIIEHDDIIDALSQIKQETQVPIPQGEMGKRIGGNRYSNLPRSSKSTTHIS